MLSSRRRHAWPALVLSCCAGLAVAAADGSTPGMPPQLGHLQSMVGLVWRSVILWMLLVALLTLANVLG